MRKEARSILQNEIVDVENLKFGKVVTEWMFAKKNQVKESVFCNYEQKIRYYFKDFFFDKPIIYFRHYDFNEYVNYLKKRLSDKTVKDIVSLLKQIFKYIEVKYDINFKLSLIKSPTVYQRKIDVFTEREKNRIKTYCLNSSQEKDIGVLIALFSGIRIGELCGLKWGDIDFENKSINIKRTIQRIYEIEKGTRVIETLPKTATSLRIIPLSNILYTKLKPLAKKHKKEDYILSGNKKIIEPQAYRYTYKNILKKCRVKHKKFHTLRHTFATNCIKVGMDPKSLSEVLGHSNVDITLNLYVHPSFETKKKFIDKL